MQHDPNYMIIKKWIPEHGRDILFEHTRKLRQSEIPGLKKLKEEQDKLSLMRAMRHEETRTKHEIIINDDSIVDTGTETTKSESEAEGEGEDFAYDAKPEDDMDIVNKLLAEYTTLFEGPDPPRPLAAPPRPADAKLHGSRRFAGMHARAPTKSTSKQSPE